ncbi:hypothetical protein GCM10010468_29390 [Actinocorallia longicatena]|uniref:Transposase IS200 family protein n=2 Tax=Actinocorallia longicatena TaxID=111803 RepID=A0ABP6Q9C4_9ACTN
MMTEVHRRTGVWIRSIADHVHFAVPGRRDLLRFGGCVDGTREAVAGLLEGLLAEQAGDPGRRPWGRVLGRGRH